jgi:hypothetical protein
MRARLSKNPCFYLRSVSASFRAVRAQLFACLAFTACGTSGTPPPDPPIVGSISPASGPWGTEVTIDGVHFGGAAGTGKVAFDGAAGANGFVVDSWNDNEIKGRVAFPASGSFSVQTAAGSAAAGEFAPDMPWAPSGAYDVTELVDASVMSTGDTVAVFQQFQLVNQAALVAFSGASMGTYQLAGLANSQDANAPVIARVVETDEHTPLVVGTQSDGTVAAYGIHASSIAVTATGLSGTVLAAARDASGVYAWIATSSGLVRARPGATAWTTDRGPMATPMPPLTGTVAADGTLWIAVSEPAPASKAFVSIQTLGPTDVQLGAIERVDPNSYDGAISIARIEVASDGVHALVIATATASGTPTVLTPRLRKGAGSWSDAPAMPGLVQYAFVGTTLAGIVNDATAKTTSFVADATMPTAATVIPVWPAMSQAVVIDGSGKPHPFIGTGSVTYALTPP